MRRQIPYSAALAVCLVLGACCWAADTVMDRPPRVDPDYAGVTIPSNIAPLNFRILEPGDAYEATFRGKGSQSIEVAASDGGIVIPEGAWRTLLAESQGASLEIAVRVKDEAGTWQQFQPFSIHVAKEPIDKYIGYRLMKPWYIAFDEIGVYQRDLESYDEHLVMSNELVDGACMNCHSFLNYGTERVLIHYRWPFVMLSIHGDEAEKIDTRTDFNSSAFAYVSWHPSGRVAAFSVNRILQVFHTRGETRDAYDTGSDLLVYDFEANAVVSAPQIASLDAFETFPAWSQDGRYLYFVSTPAIAKEEFRRFKDVRYDLMRVGYDVETGAWGELETVLAGEEIGGSITEPRVSPDGRFVLFTLSGHGSFPVFQGDSDLWMLELETGRYWRLDCNSERSESWHAWSSNGRWIAFSSKRRDPVFTRLYFCYVDEQGKAHKPFLLPQRDPGFYDGFLKVYNVPEFANERVQVSPRALAELLRSKDEPKKAQLSPAARPFVEQRAAAAAN